MCTFFCYKCRKNTTKLQMEQRKKTEKKQQKGNYTLFFDLLDHSIQYARSLVRQNMLMTHQHPRITYMPLWCWVRRLMLAFCLSTIQLPNVPLGSLVSSSQKMFPVLTILVQLDSSKKRILGQLSMMGRFLHLMSLLVLARYICWIWYFSRTGFDMTWEVECPAALLFW